MEEYIYDAFISYSHRDMTWARWLQRRLETFRIPRGLCPEGTAGRRLRVFRDQTDLAGVELQEALERELRASRCLIVLCSPNSAASRWVDREILAFRTLAGERRVIPFIVEGEPESEDPTLECYPPALRRGDGHALGANVQEIGKDKAFLKLVSILLDVRFNRLVDREKQRRRRTGLIAGLTAAAVLGSTSLLLWRNAQVTRKNQELSYDIYGAALVSIAQKEEIEPEDVAFLRVSAEAGNLQAIFLLADCCQNGWGMEKDPEGAFYWYSKAAEAGDATAMVAVANCYRDGIGTDADPEQSFLWDLRSAESGDGAGMLNTAICYELGTGTPADPEAAFSWYKKSAESGYDLAIFNLARCYRDGIGTPADPEQMAVWMKKLADTGNAEAMYNMGLMTQYGMGTPEDPRQAYLWYERAALAGDADAMYKVAWCIENGFGSDGGALEWYRLALENGRADAAEDIRRLTE